MSGFRPCFRSEPRSERGVEVFSDQPQGDQPGSKLGRATMPSRSTYARPARPTTFANWTARLCDGRTSRGQAEVFEDLLDRGVPCQEGEHRHAAAAAVRPVRETARPPCARPHWVRTRRGIIGRSNWIIGRSNCVFGLTRPITALPSPCCSLPAPGLDPRTDKGCFDNSLAWGSTRPRVARDGAAALRSGAAGEESLLASRDQARGGRV
jgi:hypothetical protein